MMLHTTLNQIRSHSPCSDGWETLLRHLGKIQADDEPLSFATILESNGLNDALWCLRVVEGYDREIRLYNVWCARQVEYLDPSGVAKQINDISLRYANGEATEDELEIAWEAARAAREAQRAAREAAMAAMAAEGKAARVSWEAQRAAREAQRAAREAAMAAREAAMAAEGKAARASWEAQRVAREAQRAAREAAMAAREAAMAAAWEEAWVAQKQEFIKRFCTEE